jgi:hypothetical protein
MKYIVSFLLLFSFAVPAFAIGATIIATTVYAGTVAGVMMAMAINMIVSTIIAKAFFSPNQGAQDLSGQSPNLGNRQQISPATDNKLPVVYGSAWVGGTIIDLSITEDNQNLYYVLALSEVTNNGADTITFGDIYYGGKKVVFNANGYSVDSLLDESTGESQPVNGNIQLYLYSNGINSPQNSSLSATQVMQSGGLVWQWDGSQLMTNCCFAILHLTYNQDLNIQGIEQTKFQITNSRNKPGDCIFDYLTNIVYGAAIPAYQIDTASLTALNTYCDGSFTYEPYVGGSATQTRFRFDGLVETSRAVMKNLQDMTSSCDCLLKYNEILGTWGVVVQSPTYTVAMNINDSNMVSALSITPMDIASSYNIIECKFPDETNQDSFNAATFDLAEIAPGLLFQNEPVNKQSVSLPLVNNDVRAQYLATRMLKAAREDLQVQCTINYVGLQLEAGDIVSITNVNYGWVAKLFRINKVVQTFEDSGQVLAKLTLSEYNPAIYDDVSITQFMPVPNSGIGSPTLFGTIPAPVVAAQYPIITNPTFIVSITSSTVGIIQYSELWYSAFSSPTQEQLIFAGTTEIQPSGNPYPVSASMPSISISDIPSGNWYFFSRMVNSIATSPYSSASSVFQWRPSTFQYAERYLVVAYADSITGTGFNLDPRGHSYYGLLNQDSVTPSTTASDYTWYLADPNFGTVYYLCYSNRTGRKFSFDTGLAVYAAGTGSFVPSQTTLFDPTIWAALQDGINFIDLDRATGQLLTTGTTSVGTGEINVTNTPDGKVIASLQQFLDFGGAYSQTSAVATLTIDIYGRVVGFQSPDDFYFTKQSFTATSSQTVFSVTRASGYISGQCFVLQNGCLLDTSEYTDTGGATGTVTLSVGATTGDIVTIVSFKSSNSATGVYASFTRNTATLTSANEYTASGFTLASGFELLFLNGTVVNEQDYNIVDQTITDFPNITSGKLTVIQWSPNNLTVPNGNPVNIIANTGIGQTTYPFNYDVNAFNLYNNGLMFLQGTDYTTASGTYTLSNTPTTITNLLLQQTFARTGAV